MTARDRKIDREIEETTRLIAWGRMRLPRRDDRVRDEPPVKVCLYVPPPYQQRPLK
jgi:hypothetical protein